MNTFQPLTALLTSVLLSFSAVASWNSELILQETKTLQLHADSLTKIKIDAGSGSMSIIGNNSDTINVTARIYQEDAHDGYQLSLQASGEHALLIAENKRFSKNTRIDLEVQLPSRFTVNIHDGSGAITLANVKTTQIKDGSGSISLSDIAGDVKITDGSGSISVNSVEGSLTIDDGSGSITAEAVEGFVTIEDGSGNIDVRNVKQDVSISDGSGSITVDQAANFTLVDDGSGSVNITNITGKVNMNE